MSDDSKCYICEGTSPTKPRKCGHIVCTKCKYDSKICMSCGLRIDFSAFDCSMYSESDDVILSKFTIPTPLGSIMTNVHKAFSSELDQDSDSSRDEPSDTQQDPTSSRSSVFNFQDFSDCPTESNPVPQQSPDQVISSSGQRFLCYFHKQEVIFKHTSKNKFYCTSCNVNTNYVMPYSLSQLREDLMNLQEYAVKEQIDLDFDLSNLLRLSIIWSKTILVLNMKVAKRRQLYDRYIPSTDGKGPVTRFNVRRWRLPKVLKTFGSDEPEENKVFKWANEVLVHYGSAKKSKTVKAKVASDLLTNLTERWQEVFDALLLTNDYQKADDVEFPVSTLKAKILEEIKEMYKNSISE